MSRALVALLGVALALPAAAQQQPGTLTGLVVDEAGAPLPGLVVSMHRVSPTGGGIVANDTAGVDGRFDLPFTASDGDPVYFAATRRNDTLFVGPPTRLPLAEGEAYALIVSPRTAFTLGGTRSGFSPAPAPGEDEGPGAVGVVLVALLLTGILGTAAMMYRRTTPDRRGLERRRALLALAGVEEALSRADGAERERLQRTRESLRARVHALDA